METSLFIDPAAKQMGFKLRERITTKLGVALKANGIYNTTTGDLEYRGTLTKSLTVGSDMKDAGSTPLSLGLGLVATSDSKDPRLYARASKKLALLDGPNTLLSSKLELDMALPGNPTRRRATFKVSHKAMNFTKRQDLKISGGMDVEWPVGAKKPEPTLMVEIRENNWAARLRRNKWTLTYDL